MRAYIQSAKDNGENIGENYLIYLLEFKRNIRAIGLCMPMDVIFGGRMLILIGWPTIVQLVHDLKLIRMLQRILLGY